MNKSEVKLSDFLKVTVRPTPRKVRGDGEASQAFIDELRRLYDKKYNTKSPAVRVHLNECQRQGYQGWYESRTRSIYAKDSNLNEYKAKRLLIHELAHHYEYKRPIKEGNTRMYGPGPLHGTIFRLYHWRLRAVAGEAGLLTPPQESKSELEQAAALVQEARELMGKSVLTMGQILLEAKRVCLNAGEKFDLFLEDRVGLDMGVANGSMWAQSLELPAQLDFDTMRFLITLKDTPFRAKVQSEALSGTPLFILRLRYKEPRWKTLRKLKTDILKTLQSYLVATRGMLERWINKLEKNLNELTGV